MTFPFRIMLVEINPSNIAEQVLVARALQGYPQWVVYAVPPDSLYPLKYSEVKPVLMQGNPTSILATIGGNIIGNTRIWQIYIQTVEFVDRAVLECSNIKIKSLLTFMDKVSQLWWTTTGNYIARVQIVKARTFSSSPDTPLRGEGYSVIFLPRWSILLPSSSDIRSFFLFFYQIYLS